MLSWRRTRIERGDRAIPAQLRYRGRTYRIEDGRWRGPDGHTVHLLTWVTDDLARLGEAPDGDLATARKVAERLGAEARGIEDLR